jgi:glycosyltransferase involved in cell wall biosynthesis
MTARRVLWLAKGLGRGGAERLLQLAAARIDPDRFAVEVAYLLPWKDALVGELDVPVHCLDTSSEARPGWVRRLRRLARDRGFDLVHTHSPLSAAVARVALPRGVRMVHTEHNTWPRYRRPTRWANRITYRRNAAVIAVSAEVAATVRHPQVEVVHHGIDEQAVLRGPEARGAARQALAIDPDAPALVTVANFVPKKDHATLLEAAGLLAADHPGLAWVLLGAGPLEDDLRRRAADLGVAEVVRFAGSRDDVQALLPAFDAFVLTSRHEGLPIAMLEAMAAGVPVVATDVGGVGEALRPGAEGLLTPPADPQATAVAVDKVLRDAELRAAMGEQGAATAAQFSIDAAVRRLEALYGEVLAR